MKMIVKKRSFRVSRAIEPSASFGIVTVSRNSATNSKISKSRFDPLAPSRSSLRLYKDDLETLKKLAKHRGVGHMTLARSIVERWLVASSADARDPGFFASL